MFEKIKKSIKYIKLKDIMAIFIFILVLPISLIYKWIFKMNKKHIWLICEDPQEARDNGYHLFKYIREKHPKVNIYYAINKKSNDYNRLKEYGNIIQYGSLKHWIYYLVADKNISTQKAGNPNAPLFYFLQVYGLLKNKRYFLQHGIIMNNNKFLHYNETKFSLFVCGAKKEYEYVSNNFGYPNGIVKYLGLARYDNLYNYNINKKQIVFMPSWRDWLAKDVNIFGKKENFVETNYFKKYNSLINNKKLIDYIEKKDITIYFFPHRNMQKLINNFITNSKNIKLIVSNEIDIQDLIKESALMVTDYSSVNMDFAYMKKPLIYYQFDKLEFRSKQYEEGYFSYENDGFGPVIEEEEEVVQKIIDYIEKDYELEKKYIDRIINYFDIHDQNNCKRNYEAIKNM